MTRDAKTSRYFNGVQSVTSNQSQAVNRQDFFPVDPSVSPTPPDPEEVLQPSELKIFTYNDLSVATRDFHADSVLGEGGFGCVFKGWVDKNTFAAAKWGTGLAIAVKRLNQESMQGHKEWSVSIDQFEIYNNFYVTFCFFILLLYSIFL